MKEELYAIGFLLWCVCCPCAGQVQWQDLHGAYTAIHPVQFAFAYQSGGTQPQAIFLAQHDGTVGAHLARTTNDGESWHMIEDVPNALAVATDPGNPNNAYAWYGAVTGQVPLKKSTDGGDTWFSIGMGFPDGLHVAQIAVSPHSGNLLYMGAAWGDVHSLWQSTDGGLHWEYNRGFLDVHTTITAIVFDPTNANRIFVSGIGEDPEQSGVWVSPNGGQSWVRKVGGMSNTRIGGLGMNPRSSSMLFACSDGVIGNGSHIYKTTDAGDQWSLSYESSMAVQFVSAAVSADGGRIFAGGRMNTGGLPQIYSFGVITSSDSGSTWSFCNEGLFIRSMETVAADPRRSSFMLAGAHGAVYRSTNQGQSWNESNAGLVRLSSLSVASCGSLVMTTATVRELGGKYGGVVRSTNTGATWQIVDEENEGTYTSIYDVTITDRLNRTVLAGGRFGRWGNQNPNMKATIIRSTDEGTSWATPWSCNSSIREHQP